MEIWKTVKNYPYYKVSNYGRVKSIDRITIDVNGRKTRRKGVLLKFSKNHKGYFMCVVYDGKIKRKHYSVHRLVAENFIENTDKTLQVNHKDGNKENNHVDNLEWISCKDNINHAWKNGLCENTRKASSKNGYYRNRGKLSKAHRTKKVINIETGYIIGCLKELCINENLSYNQMQKKLRGERKNNTPYRYLQNVI